MLGYIYKIEPDLRLYNFYSYVERSRGAEASAILPNSIIRDVAKLSTLGGGGGGCRHVLTNIS